MKLKSIYSLLILIFCCNFSFAQKPDYKDRRNYESCNCGYDSIKRIVYQYDWKTESALVLSSLLSFGLPDYFFPISTNLTLQEIQSLNRNNINAFDRPITYNFSQKADDYSYYILYGLLVTPGLYVFNGEIQSDIVKIGIMYVENVMLAGSLPSWTKESVKRIRPFVYNENAPINTKFDSDSRRSFFSGHTTLAFSSAVFLTKVYSDYFPDSKYTKYIAASSLLAATTVGALRITAGKHFYSDVITGALVGSFCGYLVPELHRITKNNNLSINIGSQSLNLSYKF
jgi:hypothetical protein